jgi:hypothetical protein
MKMLVVVLVGTFLFVGSLFASEPVETDTKSTAYCVRSDATGNGSGEDWTNAFTKLPGKLIRGHTYYVADGKYPAYTFDDPVSGEEYITVKKATASAHGTNTGWKGDYGDGTATFAYKLTFAKGTGYYVFDGMTGTGKVIGSYGFKIDKPLDPNLQVVGGQCHLAIAAPHVRASHVEIENSGKKFNVTQFGLRIAYAHDVTVSHCFIRNAQVGIASGSSYDLIIERNYILDQWSSGEHHGASTNFRDTRDSVFRHNVIERSSGTGAAVWYPALRRVVLKDTTASNLRWKVYGNVFLNCRGRTIGNGGSVHKNIMVDFDIHHNTFVGGGKIYTGKTPGPGGKAYNNLWYNGNAIISGVPEHDYNTALGCKQFKTIESEPHSVIGKGNPFVNLEREDFRLARPTVPGKKALGAPHDKDTDGQTRGADGVVDRGAFEFQEAKHYYVRAGATGNNDGSDWNNAWTELPYKLNSRNRRCSRLERGAVYYIADGVYPRIVFNDDENYAGTQYITIKKAIESDHGTTVGWQSGYGDGQAEFPSLAFGSHYWIFDGQTGSGTSGYGFKVPKPDCTGLTSDSTSISIQSLHSPYGIHHVEIRLTEVESIGPGHGVSGWCIKASRGGYSHIRIADNYMRGGSSNMHIRGWRDCIIEGNYFGFNWSSPESHGQQISPGGGCNDIILRNNVFQDSRVFVIGCHKRNNYRWKIYNNVVLGGRLSACWANADSASPDVIKNWEIYNNTHVNVVFGGRGAVFVGTLTDVNADKSVAYNNLFYGCQRPSMNNAGKSEGAIVHDYNTYLSCTGPISDADESHSQRNDKAGDPFVDSAKGDFRLKAPSEPGKKVPDAPHDKDTDGRARGADGAVDRGAFEFLQAKGSSPE